MRAPLLLAVLTLAACTGAPDYYLLPPPQPAARASSPVGSIAVADLSLPTYANALENGGVVWDYKAKAEKDIRIANPASVLMDMTDGCDVVASRLTTLSRLFFTDGEHRAAELALRVF